MRGAALSPTGVPATDKVQYPKPGLRVLNNNAVPTSAGDGRRQS
jgi:hypothetical protein